MRKPPFLRKLCRSGDESWKGLCQFTSDRQAKLTIYKANRNNWIDLVAIHQEHL